MKRLLLSTALAGLVAFPTFAIAQSDPGTDPMAPQQTETPGDTGMGTTPGDDTQDGAQTGSDTDTGSGEGSDGVSDTSQDDAEGGATTGGSGAVGGGAASNMDVGADGVAEGYSPMDPSVVEAGEIEQAPVMSRDGDEIGDVSQVLMTADGAIDAIVVNVGGFLGMGSKPVAVPFDRLTLQTNDENGDMSIRIAMSREEIEALPQYEEG